MISDYDKMRVYPIQLYLYHSCSNIPAIYKGHRSVIIRVKSILISSFDVLISALDGELIIGDNFNMVDGVVEIDLGTVKKVTKLLVKTEKLSNTSVEQFSLNYTLDSDVLIYSDYPATEPVRTVGLV